MGILTKLVLAPLAPLTGMVWLAERLEEQAAQIYNSRQAVGAELDALAAASRRGEISDAEREEAETALLQRLIEADHG